MARSIKAVIFDLGGTLIEYAGPYDSWPDLETPGLQAAYDFLLAKGAALAPFARFRDAAFAILPGRWQEATQGGRNLRLADYLRETLTEVGTPDLPPDWIAAAAQVYQGAICSAGMMIDGAPQVLQTLHQQGYRIALLSNTMFDGAIHVADLQRFGLEPYFDVMLFSADEALWKPDAGPYLRLVEQLQVAPDEAVFIGDSPHHDIVGGQAAGLHTVYFRSSDRFEELDGLKPDAVIDQLSELPDVLAGWDQAE